LEQTQIPVVEVSPFYNFPAEQVTTAVAGQVRLLHCWGGVVATGLFRQMAAQLMPQTTAAALAILN
jgi:hypothetical protein